MFGTEFSRVPVPRWKLDQAIFDRTRAILSANFNVKHIPTKFETYAPLRTDGGLFRDPDAERKALIQPLTASSGCDYILLVGAIASPVGSTNQFVSGLGVLELGSELFGHTRQVHALTFLHVYDGRSMGTLQSSRGETEESTFFNTVRGPSREIDAKLHPTLQAVAGDTKTRDMVWKQVERSLELTLPKLFDVKTADRTANTPAQTVRDRPAKKDDWSPF